MTQSHTPGPWGFAAAEYTAVGVSHMTDGAMGKPIAAGAITARSPMGGGEGWHYVAVMNSHSTSEADARLISAAPELLEALKSFDRAALAVVYANNAIEAKNAVRSLNSEIDRARAIIAKATGEQQ